MSKIAFQTIDWSSIATSEQPGEKGIAVRRAVEFNGLRIRMVTYTAGYMADHWCSKGHIVHCLEGAFVSENETGESFTLSAGMTYVVSDDLSNHRSSTKNGVTLLIIDGDFLKLT